ncbi:RNase P subunit p30-domain-containing protein [Amanita rubescens]|nr:RNase P subunit p30-domain-containing protein [Amanita rubescens]
MFFDLNLPIDGPPPTTGKSKGKAPQADFQYSPAQISAIEARIDLLVHLGYSVLAFTQTILKKFDAKTHINTLDILVPQLRPRSGILYLKRLNIILDEDSEKGFGLINANTNRFSSYDILSLTPTNVTTFSLACLTHTVPSPLTTHIISLPLTLPRFNFHLKHTFIRTALKNGAAFEITYAGALGGQPDALLADSGFAETGQNSKRNWWANAREIVRVTKGKGIVLGSGTTNEADLRAPRDVQNLVTLLNIPQDLAHHALTTTPKSITIRAQTRRTYRAVFSEPKVVVPEGSMDLLLSMPKPQSTSAVVEEEEAQVGTKRARARDDEAGDDVTASPQRSDGLQTMAKSGQQQDNLKSLGMERGQGQRQGQGSKDGEREGLAKKKKRKKNNKPLESTVGS